MKKNTLLNLSLRTMGGNRQMVRIGHIVSGLAGIAGGNF